MDEAIFLLCPRQGAKNVENIAVCPKEFFGVWHLPRKHILKSKRFKDVSSFTVLPDFTRVLLGHLLNNMLGPIKLHHLRHSGDSHFESAVSFKSSSNTIPTYKSARLNDSIAQFSP